MEFAPILQIALGVALGLAIFAVGIALLPLTLFAATLTAGYAAFGAFTDQQLVMTALYVVACLIAGGLTLVTGAIWGSAISEAIYGVS